MNMRTMIRIWLLAFCMFLLAGATGCASGGSSRGRMSQVSTDDSRKDPGRGSGQTRTRNDTHASRPGVQTSNNDDDDGYYYDPYAEEEEPDGLTMFLAGLVGSLFSGGDDEEAEEPASNNYSEFGTSKDGNNAAPPGDQDGGGLDITRGNLNFWYSRAQLSGDAIRSFTNYSLMYSGYTGARYRGHAGVYYGQGKKGNQQWVQDEIRWVSEAGIDVGSRGYFTPEHSLLGFYMILGLRAGALYWSYTDALGAVDDTGAPEPVSHDGVMIFTPYLGFGCSLLQTKSVHLGVGFTVGGRMTLGKTFKKYENDVFQNVGEYKLNIEASIFF